MDNITEVNFSDKNGIQGALEGFRREMNNILEYQLIMAEYRWKVYQFYVEQGFNEEQALNLCAHVTGTPQ